eukprot:51292-Pyramimonas_sp.AAC.1
MPAGGQSASRSRPARPPPRAGRPAPRRREDVGPLEYARGPGAESPSSPPPLRRPPPPPSSPLPPLRLPPLL